MIDFSKTSLGLSPDSFRRDKVLIIKTIAFSVAGFLIDFLISRKLSQVFLFIQSGSVYIFAFVIVLLFLCLLKSVSVLLLKSVSGVTDIGVRLILSSVT